MKLGASNLEQSQNKGSSKQNNNKFVKIGQMSFIADLKKKKDELYYSGPLPVLNLTPFHQVPYPKDEQQEFPF